ncbi:MAG TPA: tripartite tricarboxylate transporter substrate binding protein [Burkholderiales bacterium]|nr:tripartite tricarboxylate transporter substrate binding protein [Burkholderiales bacterium]
MKIIIRIFAAIAAAASAQAFAQGYPNKPVHAVISFTPGSSTDIVGRVVTQKLSEFWGQPVVAENRAGAGGSIGTAAVFRSDPDGYTLLIDSSAHTITPWIYAHLPYDTAKDFTDVAPLAGQPNVLVVAPGSRYKSLKDLIDYAKANPGKVNFGSAGVGSGTHLNLEKFKLATGINVTHIPYKGTPEVVTNIIGGLVDCYWAPISAGISFINQDKLKALAVSGAKRSGQLPNVPTAAEAGVPGFDFTLWFGVWGPKGMPADVVNKINADVRRALESADVKDRLAKLGNDTMIMSPSEFSAFVRKEMQDNERVVKAAGIKPQ